jgi:hypothetical protein
VGQQCLESQYINERKVARDMAIICVWSDVVKGYDDVRYQNARAHASVSHIRNESI